MVSNTVSISSADIGPALDLVEKTTLYIGYPKDYASKMRLLSEELISSIKNLLDDVDASLWVDTDDTNMRIHLKMDGTLSDRVRNDLVTISSNRRNEPPKGLFAKIGAFFSDAFMTDEVGYTPLMLGEVPLDAFITPVSLIYTTPPVEEKDDLKGIEANILKGMADDVTVCARPTHAELTVIKKLPA